MSSFQKMMMKIIKNGVRFNNSKKQKMPQKSSSFVSFNKKKIEGKFSLEKPNVYICLKLHILHLLCCTKKNGITNTGLPVHPKLDHCSPPLPCPGRILHLSPCMAITSSKVTHLHHFSFIRGPQFEI
jgi:hypothetical protein